MAFMETRPLYIFKIWIIEKIGILTRKDIIKILELLEKYDKVIDDSPFGGLELPPYDSVDLFKNDLFLHSRSIPDLRKCAAVHGAYMGWYGAGFCIGPCKVIGSAGNTTVSSQQ